MIAILLVVAVRCRDNLGPSVCDLDLGAKLRLEAKLSYRSLAHCVRKRLTIVAPWGIACGAVARSAIVTLFLLLLIYF